MFLRLALGAAVLCSLGVYAAAMTPAEIMHSCNEQARDKVGDERKDFIKQCIVGAEAKAAEQKHSCVGAAIGDPTSSVLAKNSCWGKPQTVNRTVTSKGVHEQWVYRGGYLYFDNGVLTAIQN